MRRPFSRLTVAQVASYPRPGMVAPGRIEFTPDGRAVTYLYSAEGNLVRSLWRLDLGTGERAILAGPPPAAADETKLSREEELRRERARLRELGVTDYQWAEAANPPVLLIPSGGRLWLLRGRSGVRELPGTEGALDARLSRDGTAVAFVRGGELWVAPLQGRRAPQRLTSGAEDGLTNGLAEFIAQEELDRSRGFWWSRDGASIAFIQADERHIPIYPIVHQGKDGSPIDVENHRYPFAGEANARLKLGVVPAAGGDVRWAPLGNGPDAEYIARVAWTPGGNVAVQLLSRDQKRLRLLSWNPRNGRMRSLIDERQEPWINLHNDLRLLDDPEGAGAFIWSSERLGYRHLGLHAADGSLLRTLTAGNWSVESVVHVDERDRRVYFISTRAGATERHLESTCLDQELGPVERHTTEPGWHGAVFAQDGNRWIHSWSTRDAAPQAVVRELRSGRTVRVTETSPVTADALGLRPPELLTVKPTGRGRLPLDAALYLPEGNPPEAGWPLAVAVYGGPHAQTVAEQWALTVDLRAQYLAGQGVAVLKVDNRGMAGRGLAFEAPIDRRMGTVEVEDQAGAVRELLKTRPFDGRRVGIYGWSYGGYMTLMAMAREPRLFRVGVAGAPVTDWDGYDTGYTERYMGTPQDNLEGYRDGSVLTHVARIEGRLLVVHGMVDENVHFRHTARLLRALAHAGKHADVLIFPEERHMPRDAKGLEYQEETVLDFLLEGLGVARRGKP